MRIYLIAALGGRARRHGLLPRRRRDRTHRLAVGVVWNTVWRGVVAFCGQRQWRVLHRIARAGCMRSMLDDVLCVRRTARHARTYAHTVINTRAPCTSHARTLD